MMKPSFKSLLLILLLLPCNTHAGELQPFNLNATYRLSLSGLPLGKVQVMSTENANQFQITANTHVVGIARLFTRHKSTMSVKGKGADYPTSARIFERTDQSKAKPETTRLTYGAGGKLTNIHLDDTHDLSYRPVVPDAMRDGHPDPLTFALESRKQLKQALDSGKKTLTLDAFDGKRLAEVTYTIYGTGFITRHKQKTPVVKIGVKRTAKAGYTEKELKKIARQESMEAIIYMSNDDRFIPLLATVDWYLGTLKAEME